MSTSFETFINSQLAVLHDRVVAEHRHHLSRLQNQVHDLLAQNAVLSRMTASQASHRGSTETDTPGSPRGAAAKDAEKEMSRSGSNGTTQGSIFSKSSVASLPGALREEVLPESLVPSKMSNGVSQRDSSDDVVALSLTSDDCRGRLQAWEKKAAPPAPKSASNNLSVLPPSGQPQELVLRPGGRASTLPGISPSCMRSPSPVAPAMKSLQAAPGTEPQKLKTLEQRHSVAGQTSHSSAPKLVTAGPGRSSLAGSRSASPTPKLISAGPGRSSLAGSRAASPAGPKEDRKVSILGGHHPDGDKRPSLIKENWIRGATGPVLQGTGDKRISFQSGISSPLHDAHELNHSLIPASGERGGSTGKLAPPFAEGKNPGSKRDSFLTSGIDRLSPLKRHSALGDTDAGIRRGSGLGVGLGGADGMRRGSNIDGMRRGSGIDRRTSNLLVPGGGGADFQRNRNDSVVSMFGANYDNGSEGDSNSASGFRPSRQRLSSISDTIRGSRMSKSAGSVDGPVKFEVAQAWVLGRFGNSMRRSSMGGAARMSQFMDHFLDKDEKAQEDSERRDQASRYLQKLVIRPSSGGHVSWDLCGLVLIAYDAVMVPLEIFSPPTFTIQIVMDWIIRFFWTLNILVSFFTGMMKDDGVVEMRPRYIARHYVTTWFALDVFLSTFDWVDIVFKGMAGDGFQRFGASWLRALRMVRSARLIRLLRAPEIAKKITELIPFHEWLGLFATVIKIMLIFLWIAHAIACIWFGIGRYMCSHGRCWIDESRVEGRSWGVQYAFSLHWSLSALSGETAMDPENIFERVYAMAILYLAFVISASYIGSITTTMTNIHMMASEQSSKLSVLRRFLLDHGISRTLAVRVQRNAQHAMIEHKSRAPESSVELLGMISQPLLVEVHYEIYSKGIMVHPFFHCYERVNPAGIRKICHTAITMLSLHTKDVLFSDLEVAEKPRTFFIVSGKLQYMHDMKVSPVLENQWMCEHALWTNWTHCGTARATMETRLLCLDAERWQDTVCTFPTDHACVYAAEFVSWLNADPEHGRSDVGPNESDITEMLLQAFPAEDEEDDESDDMSPPSRDVSFKGSMIGNIPGLSTIVQSASPSPHCSQRAVSARENGNSVIAGVMSIFVPRLGGTVRQSVSGKNSRASAHQLATEKHKSAQRRSSYDMAMTKTGTNIVGTIAVPMDEKSSFQPAVSLLARCKWCLFGLCLRLLGRRPDPQNERDSVMSLPPEPQTMKNSSSVESVVRPSTNCAQNEEPTMVTKSSMDSTRPQDGDHDIDSSTPSDRRLLVRASTAG